MNNYGPPFWAGIVLTTIAQPVAEIIAACIAQTEAVIENPGVVPEAQIFPPRLVLWGTSLDEVAQNSCILQTGVFPEQQRKPAPFILWIAIQSRKVYERISKAGHF